MKHSTFLKNAAVITFGGLAAKAIGALYRIPLMGILGGYGMGLYHMAYPLFCVLLTFSSAGIPSAFSRIIARETAKGIEDGRTVKVALRLFALLGLAGTALMCLFAPFMSRLQGDGHLANCYLALAPSVFLVALIAVFRGYFQGKNDMTPTAFSEIAEQLVKAAAGLFFAYRYQKTPELAVAYTLFAVTLSEIAALILLAVRYRGERRAGRLAARRARGVDILSVAVPVMVATSLLPLSQTLDSVVIVRLLARYSESPVSLYGLFAGGSASLVNLPATVCYGLAAASIPAVSSCFARGDREEGRRRILYALTLTLLLAAPCAAGLFLFAKYIVALLYPTLTAEEAALLVSLVRISAVSAVTLAGTDTLAACLTGMGRARRAAFAMLIAVAVKFVLQYALVSRPEIGIMGAAIASNLCYLIAFSLDLFYTVRKEKSHDNHCRTRRRAGGALPRGAQGAQGSGRGGRPHERTLPGADA